MNDATNLFPAADEIETASGKRLSLMHLDPAAIDIRDIAVGLSRANRYAGQTRRPITVAQHSILVHDAVPACFQAIRRAALLHDAAEAYLGDWIKPLKQMVGSWWLRGVEQDLQAAIEAKFGICLTNSGWQLVHMLDEATCHEEQLRYTRSRGAGRVPPARRVHVPVWKWWFYRPPAVARWGFLRRWRALAWGARFDAAIAEEKDNGDATSAT